MSEVSTENLIKQLSEDAKAVRTLRFHRVFAEWIAVVVANIIFTTQFYGVRADFNERMLDPLYIAELLLNAVLIILVGALATASAYPDRARNHTLRVAMFIGFVGYTVLLTYVAFKDVTSLSHAIEHLHMGWHCTGCILHFALIPAIYVGWRLRKLASIQPVFTGFCVLMLAGLTGTLGVRIVMPELNSPELILFHYVPLLLLSLSGVVLGKRFFRW